VGGGTAAPWAAGWPGRHIRLVAPQPGDGLRARGRPSPSGPLLGATAPRLPSGGSLGRPLMASCVERECKPLPADGFVRVARLVECQEGKPLQVWVDERPLCLCRIGEQVYAISDICTHQEFFLSDGKLEGTMIECAAHGARFDVTTGRVKRLPAFKPVKTFAVRVVDGEVQVKL
jgi:3-phenylpropionate/trans-cinnamate dioxygenase ferredoxin subunit